jgi:hypothetical protein
MVGAADGTIPSMATKDTSLAGLAFVAADRNNLRTKTSFKINAYFTHSLLFLDGLLQHSVDNSDGDEEATYVG